MGLKTAFSKVDQYNKQEFENFLTNLGRKLENNFDVAITFGASNHAVSARYLGNGVFEYIDTNSNVEGNMVHWQGNAIGLAEQIFLSFGNSETEYLPLDCSIISSINKLEINFEGICEEKPIKELYNDSKGFNILNYMAINDDFEGIRKLLSEPNLKLSPNPPRLLTSLLLNGSKDALLIVEELLTKYKITPNVEVLPNWTPLHIACGHDDYDMAELLLKHGADINRVSDTGISVIHIASSKGNLNMINLLMENGVNCNIIDQGLTAFDLALKCEKMEAAQKLLPNTTLASLTFGKHWSLNSLECSLELKIDILKKGLKDYIIERTKEPEYGNFLSLGFSSQEKIAAAAALLRHIDNYPEYKPSPQHTKTLQNGRLANLFSQYKETVESGQNMFQKYKEQMAETKKLNTSLETDNNSESKQTLKL
jgi:hypothetical protein